VSEVASDRKQRESDRRKEREREKRLASSLAKGAVFKAERGKEAREQSSSAAARLLSATSFLPPKQRERFHLGRRLPFCAFVHANYQTPHLLISSCFLAAREKEEVRWLLGPDRFHSLGEGEK
jgi:hypothetical protein